MRVDMIAGTNIIAIATMITITNMGTAMFTTTTTCTGSGMGTEAGGSILTHTAKTTTAIRQRPPTPCRSARRG